MSAPDRYRALFLAEAQELLAAAGRALGAIEHAPAGRTPAADIDALFRATHSLKGMCGAMGYGALESLAHDAETALAQVRSGTRRVDPDLVDALYAALDALDGGVGRVTAGGGSGDVEDEGARAARVRLSAALSEPTSEFAVPNATTEFAIPSPVAAHGGGDAADGVLVRVRIAPDAPLRGVRAFLALQKARALGAVSHVTPGEEALRDGAFGDGFSLRLRTDAARDEIAAAIRSAGDVAEVAFGATGATPPAAAPAAAPASGAAPGPADDAGSATTRARIARVPLDRLDALVEMVGELTLARGRLLARATRLADPALGELASEISRLAAGLQEGVLTTRLAPARELLDRLPRVVREAARASGKEVSLVVSGAGIEVDRSVLDALSEPLVHLLRNAVDHGIEAPASRTTAGKPRAGRVTVRVERDRASVRVTVADDGRGIDRAAVLRKAHAAGIVTDTAADALGDDELLALLAKPGFSTAESVTRLSGRGVGVDAVQAVLRQVGGALSLRTTPGEGTAITMRLPLTLSIVRALLARAGDETYVVPLTHVRETLAVEPSAIVMERGRERLRLREETLPVVRLRAAVGLDDDATESAEPEAVVVEAAGQRAALVVDGFAGQQEVVVKRSPPVRGALRIFGGTTILGDGAPALILDAPALLHWSRS